MGQGLLKTLGVVWVLMGLGACHVPDVVPSQKRAQISSSGKSSGAQASVGKEGESPARPQWDDGAFTGWSFWFMAAQSQGISWLMIGQADPDIRQQWLQGWRRLCQRVYDQAPSEGLKKVVWWQCQSRGPQHWSGHWVAGVGELTLEQSGWSQWGGLGLGQWRLESQGRSVVRDVWWVHRVFEWQGFSQPWKVVVTADDLYTHGGPSEGRWVFSVYGPSGQLWRYATAQWQGQITVEEPLWNWRVFWNYKPPYRWLPGVVVFEWAQGLMKVVPGSKESVGVDLPLLETFSKVAENQWVMPASVRFRGDWDGIWAFDRQDRLWGRNAP